MARKKKDATDKGVSSEETEDTTIETEETDQETDQESQKTKPVGTGHADDLERVAEARLQELEEEIGSELESDEEEPETKEQEVEKDEEQVEEEPVEYEQAVEIIVDGKKQTVPLSRIIDAGKRTFQKETAADKRLEEATKLKKEIEELRKSMSRPSGKDAADEDLEEIEDTQETDFEELQKKVTEAIQYGEDEDVSAAFGEIFKLIGSAGKNKMATAIDPEFIDRALEEKLTTREIARQFAKPREEGGFKDLTDNPRAYRLVYEEIDKLLYDGAPNEWETYQKAGDEIRKFLGWETSTPERKAEPKVDDLSKKRERKRVVDSLETASARVESPSKEEETEDRSSVIAAMARARPGQQIF